MEPEFCRCCWSGRCLCLIFRRFYWRVTLVQGYVHIWKAWQHLLVVVSHFANLVDVRKDSRVRISLSYNYLAKFRLNRWWRDCLFWIVSNPIRTTKCTLQNRLHYFFIQTSKTEPSFKPFLVVHKLYDLLYFP